MKVVAGILLCVLGSISSVAQISSPFYYNDYWKVTTRDKATYFRTGILDTTHLVFAGGVKDYFRSGQLQMTGGYQAGLRDGTFTFYYPDGQIKIQGKYDLGNRVGEWLYYYSDGALQQRVEFVKNDFHVWEYYDSLGQALVQEGNGFWANRYYEPGNSEQIIVEGEFLNGKKHGKWECRTKTGRIYYREKFEEGEFIKGKAINAIGQRSPKYEREVDNKLLPPHKLLVTEQFIFANEEVIAQYPQLKKVEASEEVGVATIDVKPTYLGGMHQVYRHIAKHLEYPEEARRSGTQGKVFVQFIVAKDGSVTEVKTIQGIGSGCDKEAERVVSMMDNWEPGYHQGKPVRVRMILPITFALDTNTASGN
ncbi:MAG: TonB family protein [Bacteroidota bacterium]